MDIPTWVEIGAVGAAYFAGAVSVTTRQKWLQVVTHATLTMAMLVVMRL